MSAEDVKAAEEMLKRVRRIKENLTCPNCGTMAPSSLGFTSICVKFKTFVCDLCKTSHQAISHRCKSVSMSTWTLEEVLDLTKQRLGGNQVARHVWLSKAPSCGGKYQGGGFLELSIWMRFFLFSPLCYSSLSLPLKIAQDSDQNQAIVLRTSNSL